MCEWGEEPEEWWAQNLFNPEKSILEALGQFEDLNSWPVLDQAFQPDLLPFGLDDELGSLTQDDFAPPELHLDFQAESNPHTLLNTTVSYDGHEDSLQRCAFKESFINASRSQTPLGSLSPQQSESTPSSSSMIAIVEQSPSPIFPYTYIKQEPNGLRDGILGLQGCESSTNLRQFQYKVEPRSGSPNSKISSQGSDVGEVSDAESDLPDEGYQKIDLLCKDETLGSDSDDPMCDVEEELLLTPPPEMHHMEFIPVSSPQDRFYPCTSVTTSVGSKKGSFSSKVGKEGEVKNDPKNKEKGMSLTEKLLIALSTSSKGPVSQKDLEGTSFKLLSNRAQIKPASKAKPVKRKPPVKVKKDTKAKKEECKVEKLEIPEIKIKKEPTPEATAKVKEEFSPEAVQEAPVRRRAGRPKKLTPAGAQFKSSQGVKRRRPSSSKASPASNGLSCSQCSTHVTPVWRVGPDGPKTLCNACGVRYMKIAKSKRKCESKGVENQ